MPDVAAAPPRASRKSEKREFDPGYLKEVKALLDGLEPGQVVRLVEHANGPRVPQSGDKAGQILPGEGVARGTAAAISNRLSERWTSLDRMIRTGVVVVGDTDNLEACQWIPVVSKYDKPRKVRGSSDTAAE